MSNFELEEESNLDGVLAGFARAVPKVSMERIQLASFFERQLISTSDFERGLALRKIDNDAQVAGLDVVIRVLMVLEADHLVLAVENVRSDEVEVLSDEFLHLFEHRKELRPEKEAKETKEKLAKLKADAEELVESKKGQ